MIMKFKSSTVQLLIIAIVVTSIAMAQEGEQQCSVHRFDSSFIPGSSCEDIYNKNSQSHDRSGYYWITDGLRKVYCGMSYTGLSCEDIYSDNPETRDKSGYYRITNNEWVYCTMTAVAFSHGDLISSCAGMGGIWKRIASLNTTAGDDCPSPWVKSSVNNVSFCIPASVDPGCYSVNYSTNGLSYQRVCGRASAYQRASPDGFQRDDITINDIYVDGISITHGDHRQHIWTYAIGVVESGNVSSCCGCPCTADPGPQPPDFVGSNYYCESGVDSPFWDFEHYLSDVLWDEAECFDNNTMTCCSNTANVPWFYRDLNVTTQDDIEVRSCMNEPFHNEAVLITNIELYVQ